MSTYIVAFEVSDSTKKNNVKQKLRKYSGSCPINDNCWAIISEDTPVEIRDSLFESMDKDDRVFVIRSGTYSAWQNAYSKKNNEWLQEHL